MKTQCAGASGDLEYLRGGLYLPVMATLRLTMNWHERAGAGWLLRLSGLGLLGLAVAGGWELHLRAMAASVRGDALAYLLALLTFICASAGAGLAVMGAHIFDQVEVAARWRRPDFVDPNPATGPEEPAPHPARASPPSTTARPPVPVASATAHPAQDEPTGPAAAPSDDRL